MNKKLNWIIIGILIIIGLVAFVISLHKSASEQSLKIGAALALTGDAAPWGEESLKAAQMATDEINATGGINGKKFELDVEDMKSSTVGGVSAVAKLVSVDRADVIMYTWLDSYEGAENSVPKDMLMISQDAAIESVNDPVNHPNVFSLWYRTSSKASVTMDAMKKAGVKKVYIVLQHDSYYTTLAKFFDAEAAKQGIAIVGEDLLNPTDDARTAVAKINNVKPDAIFFGSYDEKLSIAFIKRYREIVKNAIPVYGDEFIEQDLANANFSPAWFEGMAYYVPSAPDSSFADKFQKRFGHAPMFSAGTTYDTVYVIAQYLKAHPSSLSGYMKDTVFNTITYGQIRFDAIGGVISNKPAISMKQILGGKAVEVK